MTETYDDDATVAVVESQISTDISGETVVLQLDSGTYYGIDGVGTRVWELLQAEPRTVGELADRVTREYDVERERAREDVDDLLADLSDADLVERVDG